MQRGRRIPEGRQSHLVCPLCEHEQTRFADWCTDCGAYLGLLKRQPQRIAYCVAGSVALGAWLFCALAWQVFAPVFRGSMAAEPGAWFWWGFGSATFFLALGLTARSHLASALQRMLGSL